MDSEEKKHCALELSCAMYDLFKLAGMQGLWQALYCHSDFERCARYQAALEGRPVADHLLPDGKLIRLTRRPPKA